jgi:chitobiase/beta-hexosaminidase-like protein/parallel beta helix pectate lyase-like protein
VTTQTLNLHLLCPKHLHIGWRIGAITSLLLLICTPELRAATSATTLGNASGPAPRFSSTPPPPTFVPSAGTYSSAQSATIADTATGVTIHFTTDGSTPTSSSPIYSLPVAVGASEVLKAIAVKSGRSSKVASAAYTIATAQNPPPSDYAVCGVASLLAGPSSPPPGAIVVQAGDNTGFLPAENQTYYFATGIHTLGTGQFSQIQAATNDHFIGAPGAVIDGQHLNQYAFTGNATGVTIEYLTIQNFGAPGQTNNEGVVNHDAGHGWTIQYNTVQQNAGAGVFLGTDDLVQHNCLSKNGQYGFSVFEPNGVKNIVLANNEIVGNNTDLWETLSPGCGCTGGGKFWQTDTATITGNWIHGNLQGAALWADTNNVNFDIENNLITDNDGPAIIYEISYNALIKGNTFTRNGNVVGPTNGGFPTGAVYISESGGDGRVPARYQTITITGNQFNDNFGGVILWENADRYCSSAANTSDGACTLVNPSVANLTTCNADPDFDKPNPDLIANEPYYSDCRWKTQNVVVTGNTFTFNPDNIGAACVPTDPTNMCGFQGVFSQYGTFPAWSPYHGTVVEDHITFSQNNVFSNNNYSGPWRFMIHEQGSEVTRTDWQAAPNNQDAGSTFQ